MKIEFPPKNPLQTFSLCVYIFIMLIVLIVSPILTIAIILYASFIWKVLTIIYLTYIYYDHTQWHGIMDGNGWRFFRSNLIWKNFRDYFPIELIKTAELSPDRNYILGSFPHGVFGTGILCNMGSDIDEFLKLFPGVRPKVAMVNTSFYIPIFRELMRMFGIVPVTKDSLLYYLRKSNDPKHPDNKDGFTSNAVAILVGGAQEALDAFPGRYVVTLKKRKGFVKLAIETGSSIVPTFSFGEVDIYDQVNNPPDSWLRKFQSFTKKVIGISPVIFVGRGFFQHSFGILPRGKRIVQVVGAPIEVKKTDEPTQDYVDEVHQKFMTALNDLFETHKKRYVEDSTNVKLIIQ